MAVARPRANLSHMVDVAGSGDPADGLQAADAGRPGVTAYLARRDWHLMAATASGLAVVLPTDDWPLSLRLGDGRFYAGDGCNHLSGTAQISADTVRIAVETTTWMACPDNEDLERVVSDVLRGTLWWSIADDVLTLTKPGVGTLSYRLEPRH